jgi:EmrB/QacA subfamily drug resistance transporter
VWGSGRAPRNGIPAIPHHGAMQRRSLALAAVVLGSGIVFLDSTVVNVALKAIGQDLPTTFVGVLEGQSYIVNGYLLTLSALLILSGALADTYGRRRMFILGLGGFGASSVLCGLAPNMEVLIGVRLLQGAFGAVLVPSSLAIINSTFQGAERGRAFGVWAAASGVTTIAGPVLGGFLVDSISWRVAFLINAPLVVAAIYLAVTAIDESRNPDATGHFDWLGAGAIALAVGGLSFGGIRGQATHWADPSAFISLAIGAVTTIALVPLMTLRPDPLVPPSLFRSRNFTVTNLSTMLIYGALYCYGSFQAIFLQGTLGYSALAGGLTGVPTAIFLAVVSTQAGTLAGRIGPRLFMTVGPALMAVGLLWLVRIPSDSQAWHATLGRPTSLLPPGSVLVDLLPAILVFGLGISLLVAPLTTALMTSVPARNSGLASAINNALSRIGPLLATAVIFIGVTASFYGGLGERLPGLAVNTATVRDRFPPLNAPENTPSPATEAEITAARGASTDAFHLAMLIAAGLCAAGAVVNGIGIRNQRPEA